MGRAILLLIASHVLAFYLGVWFMHFKTKQELHRLREQSAGRLAKWLEEMGARAHRRERC